LIFSDDVSEIEDLKIGMVLPGTVTNVTNFGAFVDIGVHQDGLVHISELSNQFVDDPGKVVSVGQTLNVRVIDVDVNRRRINLSCRLQRPEGATARSPGKSQQGGQRAPQPQKGGQARDKNQRFGGPKKPEKQFTMDDLLAKFNTKR
jgi:uncharacterized protein